jgi:hypothetical protein
MADYIFQDWQLRKAGAALLEALKRAGDSGIPIDDCLGLVRHNLGTQVAPEGQDLGKLCRYAQLRRHGDRYYLRGKGPRDDVETPNVKTTGKSGKTYEFEHVDVAVNGTGTQFSAKKVKKVIIILSTLLLAVFVRMVTG